MGSKLTYIIVSAGVSFLAKFRTTLEFLIAVGAASVLLARPCVFDAEHEHFVQTCSHISFIQTNTKPQEWWPRNFPSFLNWQLTQSCAEALQRGYISEIMM